MHRASASRVLAFSMILALALMPERASACSCGGPDLVRRVSPADGDVDFPIDGTLRVFLTGFPESVRAAVAAEYRLRDAAGVVVALDTQLVGTRIDLRPHARLAPTSTYSLEQLVAYDATGTRLTDLGRVWARGPLRAIWYPVVSFRTSGGPASARAVTPAITTTSLRFRHGGGDCGPGALFAAELTLPPGAIATDLVELRVRSLGVVTSAPAIGLASLHVGDTDCSQDPVMLPAGDSVDVQAVVIDAAGTELGASAWQSATGSGTRSPSRPRISPLGAPTWPSVTIVPAPASVTRGPSGCANGLEVVSRHELVTDHATPTALTPDGSARWIAYEGGGDAPMQLFTVAADGAGAQVSTTLAGSPAALVSTDAGPVIAYGRRPQHVTRLDASGVPLWTRDLDDGSHAQLARGGGHVLVTWAVAQPDYNERLAFSIFDERTGAAMADEATMHDLASTSGGAAVAWVGGRFMVVMVTGRGYAGGPLASFVVSRRRLGPPHDLSAVAARSPPALVAAGARAGLATGDGTHIFFTVLDRAGDLSSGPFEVGVGIGGYPGAPRIAWNGSHFAIAWQTSSPEGLYVAAADTTGAVSSAVRVDAGERYPGSLAITPTPSGWVAGYTTERTHGRTVELRCAASAPTGPPQTIDPDPSAPASSSRGS